MSIKNTLNQACVTAQAFITTPSPIFSNVTNVLNSNAQFHFVASLEHKTISCSESTHGHGMEMTVAVGEGVILRVISEVVRS